MEIIKSILVLVAINLTHFDIEAQKIGTSDEWKTSVISDLKIRYKIYIETILNNCFDSNRDLIFDLDRKVRGINEYAFDLIVDEFRKALHEKGLPFDSAIMFTVHSLFEEEVDGYGSTYFYVFHNNDLKGVHISYQYFNDFKYEVFDEKRKAYRNLLKFKDGCGYGIFIITSFDQSLRWVIRGLIINPDETM